eukprot:IDg6535t1
MTAYVTGGGLIGPQVFRAEICSDRIVVRRGFVRGWLLFSVGARGTCYFGILILEAGVVVGWCGSRPSGEFFYGRVIQAEVPFVEFDVRSGSLLFECVGVGRYVRHSEWPTGF